MNPRRNKPQTTLVRILTNYFHVISLVRQYDLDWPGGLTSLLDNFSVVFNTAESFYSWDCVFYQVGFKKIPSYYTQVVFMGITPFLVIIPAYPIWALIKWRFERKAKREQTEILKRGFLPSNFIVGKSKPSDLLVSSFSQGMMSGGKFNLGDKLLATSFVIVLLWLPSIINMTFSLFMCTSYEDGYSYLKKDTLIRCWVHPDSIY